MSEQTAYRRRISALEWWFLAYPEHLPAFNQMVLEGDGALDAAELRRAVETVAAHHPGACLTRRGHDWVDTGRLTPVHELPGGPLDGIRFTGTEALRQPLRDGRPTSEILIRPGSPATIVFRTFHGIMDAPATFAWISDLFRALRGEPVVGLPSAVTEAELLRRIAPDPAPAVPPELRWPSPLGRPAATGERGFVWRRITVDGSHPALVAQLATTILAACRLPEARFLVPVDLRRHDRDLRAGANLTRPLQLDLRAGESWADAHQDLMTALAGRHELDQGVDEAALSVPLSALRRQLVALDQHAAGLDRYPALGTISHLGQVSLAALSSDGFSARTVYSLPNSGPVGPPELNAVEVGGRTEITVGWQDGPGVGARAEALLEDIAQALVPSANRAWLGAALEGSAAADTDVVQLFRARVRADPEAIAVRGRESTLSYGELDRRSDAVAEALRARGTGPDHVVGLLADRSAAGLIGVWGVLKAGAAYLPLDPRYPDARLTGLLVDAGARICLMENPFGARPIVPDGCVTVLLDELPVAPAAPVETRVRPGDLAWVIYTSGSTGRPKGVQVEHRGVLNYVRWATREFGIDEHSRMPWLTSPSFDPSGTSIFLTLLAGGTVVVAPGELNHVNLRYLIEQSDTATLTPSHLDLISRIGLQPSGFRSLIVVGEHLRVPAAARAQATFGPQCRIINEYGPTEITIACTSHVFDGERDTGATVPIGLPWEGNGIRLIDERGRPVTPGETGEMFLTGVQVARGYLGRPDLNRTSFVRLADGTRAYRTGDLARVLDSGELELIGRNDDQVKVRGHRIEPAEIASVLEDHPDVLRAAVIVRTRPGTEARALVAYVLPAIGVSTADPQVTPDALTAFLTGRVPHYMVPEAIVPVDDLPLVLNGKIDWRALPDPFAQPLSGPPSDPVPGTATETEPVTVGTPGTGAGDDVQRAVTEIWAKVLARPAGQIGPGADFHRLGGDSLGLLAMISAVSTELVGIEHESAFMAEFAALVRDPTVDRISQAVVQARSAGASLPG